MMRKCFVIGLGTAVMGLVPAAHAESANGVAPSAPVSDGQPTSVQRFDARAMSSPKYGLHAGTERWNLRPDVWVGSNTTGAGVFDLLVNGGTVFAIQNGTNVIYSTDVVYNGPRNGEPGGNTVTPAPGAALLAAAGLGMVGFIRRRVGLASTQSRQP